MQKNKRSLHHSRDPTPQFHQNPYLFTICLLLGLRLIALSTIITLMVVKWFIKKKIFYSS